MAKLLMSKPIVEQLLFGYADNPVTIHAISLNHDGDVEFSISGHDVPNTEAVTGTVTRQTNAARQVLDRMTFAPME